MNLRTPTTPIVAGFAAAAMLALAAPAAASSAPASAPSGGPPHGVSCSTGKAKAGEVCYQDRGNVFWVRDTRADGHHVAVNYERKGRPRWIHHSRGSGTGWKKYPIRIEENDWMAFRMVCMEGDTQLPRCSGSLVSIHA